MKNKFGFILVKPQLGENIGACARSMKNFGFSKLYVVNPKFSFPNHKAKATSVGAYDIISKTKIFDKIENALNPFNLVISLSARRRDINKKHISLNDFHNIIKRKNLNIGLMFGPEASGLSNKDLSFSNYILQIPTSLKFKSLNLSHSLTVVCYEIFKTIIEKKIKRNKSSIKISTKFKISSVLNHLINLLEKKDFFIPKESPEVSTDKVFMKRGGSVIIFLGLFTIFSAVNFHNILHLPPMLGMMFGLGLLGLYSFYLQITHDPSVEDEKFDFFRKVSRAEWDTLLFFFGVILSVGGLGFIGYLTVVSEFLYIGLGPTMANSIVGVLSAIVDNIPVMFAVITMRPEMSIDQWLLVTLTTGVGGSLLSIGSAAGVALMGQARGYYTFFGHLKWTPVIFIGYVASIYLHVLMADLPW